jgi:ubiquinone/menaquinone biosynthesis C-methylase UbiE
MNKHYGNQEINRIRMEYDRRDTEGHSTIYSYINPAFMFHMQERESSILRMLRDAKVDLTGSNVLEVGCGTGHILQRFMEFGSRKATGVELMESRILTGKKMYPNLNLIKGNAAQLPFANNSFDMVMQFMCLSSVLDPKVRQQIADEMWRVLRPEGTILFYDLRPLRFRFHNRIFHLMLFIFKLITLKVKINQAKTNEQKFIPTPIIPLSITEVKMLYNRGLMRYSSVSLDFNMAKIAEKSLFFAHFLSNLPFLRTHYLVLVRKSPKVES